MASVTQHRSRSPTIKTPSASSDEGTLADAPLNDDISVDAPLNDDISVDAPLNNDISADAEHHDDGSSQDNSAHDEIAPLGANVVEALRIVSKLEQLGLDKQQISLPKCIVLGQQSTGKSSVIEAISGIKTPRDTGTCTRCPLFIELQPSSEAGSAWHAEVSLLRQYDLATDLSHRGLDTEFEGWVSRAASKKIPFVQTNDPSELEYLIRCAQRATLSPLENPKSFLDRAFNTGSIHKTLFSPNIVRIVISKPGLPPLSFFDLPGMIGQAESDDEAFTVPLVKSLVTKYIMDPEALVLVTCALENDVANSMAAGLARDMNVTSRCMGVLTKPDRLPPGESPRGLANILDGHRFAMGHGYFIVKNLNSDEINQGLTHQDARRLEQQFFTTVAPWSTDLRSYQSRFGTVNMQQYLSSELGKRVMFKLPVIHRQIEDCLAAIEEELSRIPDTPLHTAVRTVADVIQDFSAEVRSEMAGDYGHISWNNTWKACQKAFWDDLFKLKPALSTTTGELDQDLFTFMLPGQTADEAMVIDSDNDMEPETPSKKRKHDTPTKRKHDSSTKREPQTSAPSTSPFRTPKAPAAKASRVLFQSSPSLRQSGNIAKPRKCFKLDDVARHLSSASRSRVPGQIDPQVREEMMVAPLENWPFILDGFFSDLESRLKLRLQTLFDQHFREWKGSELYTASFAIVESIVDNNLREQRTTMAAESLDDEHGGPHIFHEDVFNTDKAAVMDRYTQARSDARLKLYYAEYAAHYDREMSPAEKERFRKDDKKMAQIRKEPYSHEIDLVADISTYYMIAARRFHDSITMRIESKFFKQLRCKLRDQLQDELGIYDADQGPYNAQRLLAESLERLERRNILVAKKKALVQGLRCFQEHFQKYQAQNGSDHAPLAQSNYQRPSVSTPRTEAMESVRSHGLPLRSMSRPAA
ncbi:P-loop containing nucleoside triphosphate hydrolase protein [Didymella exigua CBS 183.55]|uniref:P-loop containing nucleoside triphosphate hydrolase protein n=1 Tax=Didymella exigua CBS 183.55 TaxID=1150837 RepID=A0A6A5RA27_9PLEO|nr:P-loop containing nucleoside triphosphate hydrolase protein [Didymella exigua CBS 183.55]KAF1925075.1 P-loop containing nucleoside triphosphate hydrolase protein [Didymella exigua CBS 183.55]